MRRTKAVLLLSMAMVPAVLTMSERADAQLRKPQAGIYAGGTIPTGDFKDEANTGWHIGGMIKARVTGAVDVRLDGAYSKFGSKDFDFTTATVASETNVAFGALSAELNLGPDSAAYPGDNSISPYITGGLGMYRFSFKGTCSGACTGFNGDPDSKTKLGFSIGAGANIPLRGFPTFAEVRYHRFGTVFPVSGLDGTATMLTASFGLKIR